MKLIVITKEELFPEESQLINQLFAAGLAILHLRKPKTTIDGQRAFLQSIKEEYHNRIVLHDCYDLTKEFNLKGIHLNSRNKESLEFKNGLTISKSCHSIEELKDISSFDYVFLSPIFDSISKEGYKKMFSDEELQNAKESGLINEKVIALGGITLENILQIKSFGFGGLAILGILWQNKENVLQKFIEIHSLFISHS